MSSTTSTTRTRAQAAAAAPVQTAEQITDALDRTEGTGDLDRREVHVYGPPGTGKTTWMTGRIQSTALHRRGRVLVSSFTVAAATELAGRNLPLPKRAVGTLHSHALRAIEYPDVAAEQIAEFNEAHPGYALPVPKGRKSASGEGRDIDVSVEEWAATGGDRVAPGEVLQGQYDRLRNRMTPRDQWPGDVARFATVWEQWKRDAQVVDFTDMIEVALRDTDEAPGDPEVIFCDEVQDNTTLELALVRKWGRRTERIILAGDDDQCQVPSDTVRTADHGDIRLDALDPVVHRLVSLDIRGGCHFRSPRRGRGGEFDVTSRPFKGEVYRVDADGRAGTFTANHRFAARWARTPLWCVYLMRRGSQWRVGTTTLFRSVGKDGAQVALGVGTRARQEGADAAWVLSSWETGGAARLEEHRVSARYGLSQAVFRAPTAGARVSWSQDDLDAHHDVVAEFARPLDALADHGRRVEHSFWRPDGKHRGRDTILDVHACNLLPGAMLLPIDTGDERPEWVNFTIDRDHYDGPVYSLDVRPHHTYITGGLAVRNCIYGFRGATVDGFVGQEVHDDDVYVLGRSYRVPWAVHRCAENWIRRVERRAEKPYSPRLDDGGDPHEGRALASRATFEDTSSLLASVEKQVAAGRTVMVLAACSYMLDPFKHALRTAGMPFHNQYRRKRGDWNPLGGGGEGRVSSAERLAAYLAADEAHFGDAWRLWTGEDVRRWSHVVKKSGIFAHGAKAAIEGLPGRELTQDEFMGLLREDLDEVALDRIAAADLDWFRENLLGSAHQAMQFPIQVAARRGGAALLGQPQVTLGTIHSVKGGQADVVYLIPDLSQKGAEQFARAGETRDGIVRQFYVGMTRAREELVVLSPTSDNAVPQVRMLQGSRRPVAA